MVEDVDRVLGGLVDGHGHRARDPSPRARTYRTAVDDPRRHLGLVVPVVAARASIRQGTKPEEFLRFYADALRHGRAEHDRLPAAGRGAVQALGRHRAGRLPLRAEARARAARPAHASRSSGSPRSATGSGRSASSIAERARRRACSRTSLGSVDPALELAFDFRHESWAGRRGRRRGRTTSRPSRSATSACASRRTPTTTSRALAATLRAAGVRLLPPRGRADRAGLRRAAGRAHRARSLGDRRRRRAAAAASSRRAPRRRAAPRSRRRSRPTTLRPTRAMNPSPAPASARPDDEVVERRPTRARRATSAIFTSSTCAVALRPEVGELRQPDDREVDPGREHERDEHDREPREAHERLAPQLRRDRPDGDDERRRARRPRATRPRGAPSRRARVFHDEPGSTASCPESESPDDEAEREHERRPRAAPSGRAARRGRRAPRRARSRASSRRTPCRSASRSRSARGRRRGTSPNGSCSTSSAAQAEREDAELEHADDADRRDEVEPLLDPRRQRQPAQAEQPEAERADQRARARRSTAQRTTCSVRVGPTAP